jgi:hypothetical protein
MNSRKMKRYGTMIFALALSFTAVAQQLPDSGFEDWSSSFDGNAQLASWHGSNVTQVGFKFTFMYKKDGRNGGSSAYIADKEVGAAGITEPAPGYMALGEPWSYLEGITKVSEATAGCDGGISFKYRPDTLKVWIKRTGSNTDKEFYHILFYSWKGTAQGNSYTGKSGGCTSTSHTNEESDIRQALDGNKCSTSQYATQVAEGWVKEKKTYSEWTQISVPIYYTGNDVPEMCNVIFSAGNYPNFRANSGLYPGNDLYVDDVELIYSSNIDELFVNNRRWSGFDPTKNNGEEQTYALGLGATAIPDIFAKRGVGTLTNAKGTSATFSGRTLSGSEITIDKSKATVGGSPVVITVKSEDGKRTSTYKIKFVAEQSSNNRPASIAYTVGATSSALPNYNGYITSYNVELPYGTTQTPTISVAKGDDGQTISITQPTSTTGTATVKVTAANGATNTYSIAFSIGKLSDNTLADIQVGGKSIAGFASTKNSYTVELPLGTTTLPQITYTSAYPDGAQTITATNNVTIADGSCSGTYNIAVKAPGNTTTRTYKLSFKITASTYCYLKSLKLDGTTIDGWDAEKNTYYQNLPLGTTALPAISYEKGDDYQTIATDASGISGTEGTYKITVTAASGAKCIYKIVFSAAKSSVSTLKAINIGGTLLTGFESDKFSYSYELPIGTTTLPAITYEKGDAYQSEPTIVSGGVSGTTRIIAKAQDGSTSTYTIVFSVKQASNTALGSLSVEGYNLVYDANQLEYSITLASGTTTLPNIAYTAADEWQTISMRKDGVQGDTKITVRAQSGATAVYIIHFSVEKSSNTALANIKIDGASLAKFHADTLQYAIELSSGTTELPTISPMKAESSQTATIVVGDVNGTTTITVTAENGDTRVYSLIFSVKRSSNRLLNMIYVDGAELAGFDPKVNKYSYLLDAAATACPDIKVDKNEGQSVSIVKPMLLGTAKITVTPEVGDPNIYTILFTDRALNGNNRLQAITIDGVTLSDFDAETFDYSIELARTATLPTIGYTKGDDTQTVLLQNNGWNGTQITVEAEDGTISTYTISFARTTSNDATLHSIELDGTLLAGFDAETTDYHYTLAADATKAPALSYTGNVDGQTYTVVEPLLAGTAQIVVTAPDGITKRAYSIEYQKVTPNDATINGIEIDGVGVAGFAPENGNYTVTVDSETPAVTIDADGTQYIAVANPGLNGTQILVTAQDGTSKEYNIAYQAKKSDIATLSDLQLYDGNEYKSIAGFAPELHEYTETLAWRTAAVPSINPVPAHDGQTITIRYNSVDSTTTVHVVAENGTDASDYTIHFPVEKSSLTALENLTVDDANELVPDFNADVLLYTAKMPYGTTTVPAIHWELGKVDNQATNQRITLIDAGLRDTAHITVTAENGDTRTYNIAFEVAESSEENLLQYYIIDGIGMSSEMEKEITLPYGTTAMPKITCVKKYDEQTMLIDNGGVYAPTTITVKANRKGVADAVYTIKPTIAQPQAQLTSISVNDVEIADFDPAKHQYVVSVDNDESSNATIAYTFDNATATIEDEEVNTKRAKITVYGKDDNSSAVYTIYFFYTKDVIPNADFSSWKAAAITTSANKPTGWTVLADATAATEVKSSATIFGLPVGSLITKGTYTPGSEVTQDGDYAKLTTAYNKVIDGSIPGLMLLGEMSATLNDGSSTTSTFGGISFRNTPDQLSMRYNAVSQSSVNNISLKFSLNNGQYAKEFTDNNFSNTWKTAVMSFTDNTLENPATMSIVINSCESDNASALKSKAASEMLVDWVKFAYNSKIAKIFVNGTETSGFKGKYDGDWIQAVKIDAELQGAPVLTFEGEVADQEYTYTYGDEQANCSGNYMTRVVNITAKAEDGTLSHYIVDLNRPFSKNAALAGIIVDGDTLKDFSPTTTDYTIEVENGTRFMPDVMAIRGNMHQSVLFHGDTITVTAEDGTTTREYHLKFVEKRSADATLANLAVEGHDLAFDAATEEYSVSLAANEALPEIRYTKQSDGQTVTLATGDTARINVVAENGTDTKEYRIIFDWAKAVTAGQLSNISVLGNQPFDQFDRATYDYHYAANERTATTFERIDATDTVVQTIWADSVIWEVRGSETHRYTLHFDRTPSDNANLANILIDGTPLTDFNDNVYEYIIERTEPLTIEAVQGEAAQTIKATFTLNQQTASNAPQFAVNAPSENYFAEATFEVTAEDGTTKQTTVIRLRHTPSSDATLAAIELNGALLTTNATDYTANKAFEPATTDYNITLACGNPKVTEPIMPNITFRANHAGQTIKMEQNGLGEATVITVTAEDGTENIYTLNFVAEKSSNANLTSLAVNYVAISEFDANTLEYNVSLSSNEVPVVSYTVEDLYQLQVELTVNSNSATLVVTAENGDTKTYTINFTKPAGSNNADLAQIEVDGVQIEGFSANKTDYTLMLPAGTEIRPDIVAVLGSEGQNVSISNNGTRETTNLVVTAADGTTTKTYSIYFDVELSDNDLLKMIYLDGDSLNTHQTDFVVDQDFAADVETYNVTLPVGTRQWPTIAPSENDSRGKGDKWQTVGIATNATDAYNATSVITVTAEKGNSRTYTINFNIEKSAIDTLADILLNINGLEEHLQLEGTHYTADHAFGGKINDYQLTWAVGSRDEVSVEFVRGDEYQTVEISQQMSSLNSDAIIVVTAENGNQRTYTLHNTLLLSDADTLRTIFFDELPYMQFDPHQTQYDSVMPYGTTTLPQITWETGDEYQTVAKDSVFEGLNGHYTLTVTAENGSQTTYTFNFAVALSDNATLNNILIDGAAISNFDKDATDPISVSLPYGTDIDNMAITYETGDEGQTVNITRGENSATISVTAADGVSTKEYTIVFDVRLADNASLANIFINAEALDSAATGFTTSETFASDDFEYYITLPYGTTELPTITWQTQLNEEAYKSVTLATEALVSDSLGTHGNAIISVVSQDEMQSNEYTLHFTVALSSNNTLKDLYFVDVIYPDFDPLFHPDTTAYDLLFDLGTTADEFPKIDNLRYEKGDQDQTVTAAYATETITCTDTTLTLTYDGTLNDGTVIAAGSTITVEAGDTLTTLVDNTSVILVTVTAQNGSVNIYVLTFEIEKSDNALLKDILIDAKSLKDFEPTIFEYSYTIAKGATTLPTIEGIASDSALQTVEYGESATDRFVQYIYCTAEDGTTQTYTINFVESTINPGDAPTAEDVCWTMVGDGLFKASTRRNNVAIAIFDTAGRLLTKLDVPLVDPNDDICDAGAAGRIIRMQRTGKTLIYVFYYNKKIVSRGKFIY